MEIDLCLLLSEKKEAHTHTHLLHILKTRKQNSAER